jgi:hypothetical protein
MEFSLVFHHNSSHTSFLAIFEPLTNKIQYDPIPLLKFSFG